MKKLRLTLLATIIALSLTACLSTDYQFGDMSKTYCAATTLDYRGVLKGQLEAIGIDVPENYCATVGLVDAMSTVLLGPQR